MLPLHTFFLRAQFRNILTLSLLLSCNSLTAEDLTSDQLEFYLAQSFSASLSSQRVALNHIGVEIERHNNDYIISASLEGYPAHAAGLERGDIIHSIDGAPYHPVYSFNDENEDVNDFFPKPETYTLEFERGGNRQTIEIVTVFENLYDSYRSAAENSVLKFSSGNKVIGYVRLWGFSRSTNDFIALQTMLKQFDDCDGLILDLRNSFGFLAESHLDFFQQRSEGYTERDTVFFESIPFSQEIEYFTRPIAILINKKTRGGGELLVDALDGRERIMSIGQPSAGKTGLYINDPADQNKLIYNGPESSYANFDIPVTPEYFADYPISLNTRSDPQYESAVSFLLGTI